MTASWRRPKGVENWISSGIGLTSPSTPGGQHREQPAETGPRMQGLLSAGIAGIVGKVITIAASLLMVPLIVNQLGGEKAGQFYTIVAIGGLIGLAELGIGSSLITSISAAIATGDRGHAVALIDQSRFALRRIGVIIAAIAAVGAIILHRVLVDKDWLDTGLAVAIVSVLVGISLSPNLGIRLLLAAGYPRTSNNVAAAVNLAQMIATFVMIWAWPSVSAACLAYFVPPLFIGMIVTRQAKRIIAAGTRPSIQSTTAGRVLLNSRGFAMVAIIGYFSYQLDPLVVALRLSSTEVTQYTVAAKYLLIIVAILGVFLMPLWPRHAGHIRLNSLSQSRALLIRSSVLSGIFAAVSVTFLIAVDDVAMQVWSIPSSSRPTTDLLLAFGSFVIVSSVVGPQSMFLNGAGETRYLVATGGLMALSNIGLSFWLVDQIGVEGPVVASTVSVILFILLPNLFFIRRYFDENGEP